MDADKRIDLIRRVCLREQLRDGGAAVNFEIRRHGKVLPAIAVAHAGQIHAYVNVCPHRGTTLDWQPGEVFDESGLYLICATHGALFEPATGLCIAGPCQGDSLQKIPVRLEAQHVTLAHDILGNFTDI